MLTLLLADVHHAGWRPPGNGARQQAPEHLGLARYPQVVVGRVGARNAAEALLGLAHKGGGGCVDVKKRGALEPREGAGELAVQFADPNVARRHARAFEISVDNEKKTILSAGGDAFITPFPDDAEALPFAGKPLPCAPRLLMHVMTERNTERNAKSTPIVEMQGTCAPETPREPNEMHGGDSRPRSIMRKKQQTSALRCGRLSFQDANPNDEASELGNNSDEANDTPTVKIAPTSLSLVERLEISAARRASSPSSGAHKDDVLVRTTASRPARTQRSGPPPLSKVDATPPTCFGISSSITASAVKPPPYILSLQDHERQRPISPDRFLNPAGFRAACAQHPDSAATVLVGSDAIAQPIVQSTRAADSEDLRSDAQLMRAFLGLPSNYVHKHDSSGQNGQKGHCSPLGRACLVVGAQRIMYLSNRAQGNVVRKSVATKVQLFPDSYGRHDQNYDSIVASDLHWPNTGDVDDAHLSTSGNGRDLVQTNGGADASSGSIQVRQTVMLLSTSASSSFHIHAQLWCGDY